MKNASATLPPKQPTRTPLKKRSAMSVWVPLLSLAFLLAASMVIGGGEHGIWQSAKFLLGNAEARANDHLHMVMTTLRLPRTLVALSAGAALGIAGCLLQSITRNPLADPGLMGVNAGAALGVVALISLFGVDSSSASIVAALLGALGASLIVVAIASSTKNKLTPLHLVLAGVALAATFRGATSFLLTSSDVSYDRYRYWILGSLSGISTGEFLAVLPIFALGIALALIFARPTGALALGDDVATALGHRPATTRVVAIMAVTCLAGAAVALCGPIAFLGLLAAFVARRIEPEKFSVQLLLAGWIGGCVLILADIGARVIIRPYEAPAGVILAVIGGPLLIVIARSRGMMTLRRPGGH
ncbi:FecCD family ABC transporter permease [Natronoglycomyces albus]|uniref:Iron ABC transporter permease n=1 Tax=Natronoglycomyces albus TaxID=2811108 RepID=A0A895XKA0_9ACTN|nr:iron ABC transporter permease [Natronoglycomyces albus]QSB03983.1 iron ABC transporter permease [Natronoglycomyces albus]